MRPHAAREMRRLQNQTPTCLRKHTPSSPIDPPTPSPSLGTHLTEGRKRAMFSSGSSSCSRSTATRSSTGGAAATFLRSVRYVAPRSLNPEWG